MRKTKEKRRRNEPKERDYHFRSEVERKVGDLDLDNAVKVRGQV